MHRPILNLLTSVAVLALMPLAAMAQDVTARPEHGTLSLTAGFRPDLPSPKVAAGGLYPTKAGSCAMFATLAPTFELDYVAGAFALIMSGNAYDGVNDAGFFMAVHTPDGQWHCDNTWAPTYTFSSPRSGKYRIWFGVPENQSRFRPTAQVTFSQRSTSSDNTRILASLNPNATARYGSIDVGKMGPRETVSHSVEHAGGIYQVPSMGEHCRGYFNGSAPDVEVNYSGYSRPVYFFGVDDDARLIVNAPDGSWWCSDGTRAVGVTVPSIGGKYRIWLGRDAPWSTPLASADLKIGIVAPIHQLGSSTGPQ